MILNTLSIIAAFISAPVAPFGADVADTPPNFEEHVLPILREYCISCHRGSRARNGLKLKSVDAILEGGSSGPAVVPGDSGSSLLYLVAAHEREPFMPPDEERMDQGILDVLREWIDGGARRTADDEGLASAAVANGPTFIAPPPKAGAVIIPEGLATQPVWWSERSDAVVAVATSPFAPVAAVAGHRQVGLWKIPEGELLGVLPFPEGDVLDLKFSDSGALLIAGGGRHGDSGLAVGWDVATGNRVFELGDEPDVALAADVTVDHGLVALGGPDRVARVISARSGETNYEIDEHTDWVTALGFSPDGVLLASADRAGGVFVWEALTGREFHTLPQRKSGVTALDWRADGMILAVGSEDGEVALFEMENGNQVRTWRAGGGVQDLWVMRDGRVATAGRNGNAEIWNPDGKRAFVHKAAKGMATSIASAHDASHVLIGDFGGHVRLMPLEGGEPAAHLRPNPPTDEERQIAVERHRVLELERAIDNALAAERQARQAQAEAQKALEAAEAAAQEAASRSASMESQIEGARRKLDEVEAKSASYIAPLQERESALQVARDKAAECEQQGTDIRARLDAAVQVVHDLEVALLEAGEGAVEVAQQLEPARVALESAVTDLAAHSAREAGLRVEMDRRLRALELWQAHVEQGQEAVDSERAALAEVEAAAERSRKDSAAVASQAGAERERLEEASREVDRQVAGVSAARGSREAGEQRVAMAEATWAELREKIRRRGGRVRDPQTGHDGPPLTQEVGEGVPEEPEHSGDLEQPKGDS